MRRVIFKLTLILAALMFMSTGVSWADNRSTFRPKHQGNTVVRGQNNPQAQTQHYNNRHRNRSRHQNRDDFERGHNYRERRHHRGHDRRDYRGGHHYRNRGRHHHYHRGRYCGRPHFSGFIVDPGWVFSFGWHDRW